MPRPQAIRSTFDVKGWLGCELNVIGQAIDHACFHIKGECACDD
jgi:hypothetical protein